MIGKLKNNGNSAYIEYAVVTSEKDIAFASVFDRVSTTVSSLCSSMQLYSDFLISKNESPYEAYKGCSKVSTGEYPYRIDRVRIPIGKDCCNQALIVNKELLKKDGKFFISTEENFLQNLKHKLLHKFDTPLLESFMKYVSQELFKRNLLEKGVFKYIVDDSGVLNIDGKNYKVSDIDIWTIKCSQEDIDNILSEGLRKKTISITKTQEVQKKLEFKSLDEYLLKYGASEINTLREKYRPLSEYTPKVPISSIKKIAMPQQATLINGVAKALKTGDTVYNIQGMGCGKSFQSIMQTELYFAQKTLNREPKLGNLKAAQKKSCYRTIVLCPSHMLEKWKREIEEEVEGAKVEIVTNLSQLVKLSEEKGKKPISKDWYIISKDFAKLGFSKKPMPEKVGKKFVTFVECSKCHEKGAMCDIGKECTCGGTFTKYIDNTVLQKGLICPHCGEILIKTSKEPLTTVDFLNETSINSHCKYCGEELWAPNVKLINEEGEYSNFAKKRDSRWVRYSHYTSHNFKQKISVWLMPRNVEEYQRIKSIPLEGFEVSKEIKVRKISPESFIKTKLGNRFFDMLIVDEAQDYKGGDSAQGHTFHRLVKASKKHLICTGTISGGMAEHFFYLFYRLEPYKMIKKGFKYCDVFNFVREYGVLEEIRTFNNMEQYNISSKAKKIAKPSCKPGINPLIYPHFLLDRAVFLDLSLMKAYLPPLKEYVELVEMDTDVSEEYSRLQDEFKELLKMDIGSKLVSTMTQTLLGYVDMPQNVAPILNPKTGSVLLTPQHINLEDRLLSKEKKLISKIKEELYESRNCVVFAEFTSKDGDKTVNIRLRDIIQKELDLKDNEVILMQSESPKAIEREAWMKDKAKQGMKVMIVNPKCVSTGVDFIFKDENKIYNYPTLIFYQLPTDLLVLWQASCRHYRLIQKEECKTIYFAYKDTLQQTILELVALKKQAAAAIQGQFSAEGLVTMAKGIDVNVIMARELSGKDNYISQQDIDIKALFAKINEQKTELTADEIEYLETVKDFKEIKNLSIEEQELFKKFIDRLVIANKDNKRIVAGQMLLF